MFSSVTNSRYSTSACVNVCQCQMITYKVHIYTSRVSPSIMRQFVWMSSGQGNRNKQHSYRRETALQGGLVMAKSGRLELGDNIVRTLQVYILSLWRNWPAKQSNSVKKRKIRAITLFKVIQGRINRKRVCDFRLVISSYWHPISYCFVVIAVYCSNFGHCSFSHSLKDLGITYTIFILGSLESAQWTSY